MDNIKMDMQLSSLHEVEIRACTLFVINYIKNKLENVNAIDINDYFFVSARNIKNKVKPYHLCRNTNY